MTISGNSPNGTSIESTLSPCVRRGERRRLACWQSDELVPPPPNRVDQNTIYLWLDAKGLPRRIETTTLDIVMGTTSRSRTEIDDNAAVPADTCALPLGKQLVVPEEVLEKEYPLAGALFTHEAAGQIFAVHEVKRDADGKLLRFRGGNTATFLVRLMTTCDAWTESSRVLIYVWTYTIKSIDGPTWERTPVNFQRMNSSARAKSDSSIPRPLDVRKEKPHSLRGTPLR
jgi:hypothetical protein